MARKLMPKRDKNPHLENMSHDGEGAIFGQPLTNASVEAGYMILDNPVREPDIDRKRMVRPRAKSFGFRERPKNFNDLDVGEAGAGVSQFRRAQFYSRILGVGAEVADAFDYNIPIGIATARAADTRPRFWHVSFFANSIVQAAADGPVSESDILRANFSNSVLKGRVEVYDESGGRFYDVNIHGTESFSFYGWGVTTYILLPSLNGVTQGFEVDSTNLAATPVFPDGTAENTLATGRIIPTFQNVSITTDQVTATVTVPGGGGSGFITIPPGARGVRIRANFGVAAVSPAYEINFAVVPATGRPAALGAISLLPGRLETALIDVPNATFIAFASTGPDPEVEWIATFVVEA